jgi:hypothetical protein
VAERAGFEREEEWIAKYRAALQDAPRKKSRFEGLRNAAQEICAKVLRYREKIFGCAPGEILSQKLTPSVKKRIRNPLLERARKMKAS